MMFFPFVTLLATQPHTLPTLPTQLQPHQNHPLQTQQHQNHRHPNPNTHSLHSLFQKLKSNNGLLWIDLENVRGKTNFELNHDDALDKARQWARYWDLEDRVIVVVDHGAEQCGFYLDRGDGNADCEDFLEGNFSIVHEAGHEIIEKCEGGKELQQALQLSKNSELNSRESKMEIQQTSQKSENFQTPMASIAVVFAGPSEKADDTIVNGVRLFSQSQQPSLVVTADGELKTRCRQCRRGSSGGSSGMSGDVHFMEPLQLIDDWDDLKHVFENAGSNENSSASSDPAQEYDITRAANDQNVLAKETLQKLDQEIHLRAQVMDAEIQLGKKFKTRKSNNSRKNRSNGKNKKQKKLEQKLQKLREKLASSGPSLVRQVTSTAPISNGLDNANGQFTGGMPEALGGMDQQQQDLIMTQWQMSRQHSNHRNGRKWIQRREQTGDRIVYAERLRRQLLGMPNAKRMDTFQTQSVLEKYQFSVPPAKAFVAYINGFLDRDTLLGRNWDTLDKLFQQEEAASAALGATALFPGAATNNLTATSAVSTHELLMRWNDSPPNDDDHSIDTLKIVAVSDTHGFESQLHHSSIQFNSNGDIQQSQLTLPEGDLLLHLGDFSLEGSPTQEQTGHVRFDDWLSKQPHKYKIVLRGNHDPWELDFPRSGAWYVTKPEAFDLGGQNESGDNTGFRMVMMPYGSYGGGRSLSSSKSSTLASMLSELEISRKGCDVFASHEPPFQILDRTYTNKHAGSSFLSNVVRTMGTTGGEDGGGAPRLWLCGHIHEGRGMKVHRFGKGGETTVVNAANANVGRARHLRYGPITVNISAVGVNREGVASLNITGVKDDAVNQIITSDSFFGVSDDGNEMGLLLAVDLGLKSGISLFNNEGKLVCYEQLVFQRDSLAQTIEDNILRWQSQASNDGEKTYNITHIAIEGGDTSILKAWSSTNLNPSILRVSPEEWRSELLLPKEKASGSNSKAAARLIARQVVSDYGIMDRHSGKFQTDAAEAVVMGLYVARKLGWISREPPVRRYTNGDVVVPR